MPARETKLSPMEFVSIEQHSLFVNPFSECWTTSTHLCVKLFLLYYFDNSIEHNKNSLLSCKRTTFQELLLALVLFHLLTKPCYKTLCTSIIKIVTIFNEQDKKSILPSVVSWRNGCRWSSSLEVERGGTKKATLLTFRTSAVRTIPRRKIEKTYVSLTFCIRGRRKRKAADAVGAPQVERNVLLCTFARLAFPREVS